MVFLKEFHKYLNELTAADIVVNRDIFSCSSASVVSVLISSICTFVKSKPYKYIVVTIN